MLEGQQTHISGQYNGKRRKLISSHKLESCSSEGSSFFLIALYVESLLLWCIYNFRAWQNEENQDSCSVLYRTAILQTNVVFIFLFFWWFFISYSHGQLMHNLFFDHTDAQGKYVMLGSMWSRVEHMETKSSYLVISLWTLI